MLNRGYFIILFLSYFLSVMVLASHYFYDSQVGSCTIGLWCAPKYDGVLVFRFLKNVYDKNIEKH